MTKVTATPMPMAVSIFLDTPRKGQMPRNWAEDEVIGQDRAQRDGEQGSHTH